VEERFSPTQNQEKIFREELIKWGIESEKAIKVAKILALNLPNERLNSDEIALIKEVCQEWLEKRRQWEQFRQVMARYSASS
jgi:hypothetical protein